MKKCGHVINSAHILPLFYQDNVKIDKEPKFTKLTYSDSGRYECEVTMGPLSRKASFELVVEGRDWGEMFLGYL